MNWKTLNTQTEDFALRLNRALDELEIREICQDLEMDHICVRLQNNSDVDSLKIELSQAGEIISSVQVNGREISIIQLAEPLQLESWKAYGIELPYPKPNHSYIDGWEHVEFVLHEAENTMNGVRHAFFEKFTHLDRDKLMSNYEYSEDEPTTEEDQMPNPTVGLKVYGVGLKFHAHPIQKIVGFTK